MYKMQQICLPTHSVQWNSVYRITLNCLLWKPWSNRWKTCIAAQQQHCLGLENQRQITLACGWNYEGAEEQRKGISSACFALSEASPGRFSFASLCKTRTHTHMMFWSLFRCVLPYHSSYCLTLQCSTLIGEDIILEEQITWTAENHTRLCLLRIFIFKTMRW